MKYFLIILILLFIFYSIPCFAYVYNPGNNPNNYMFRGSSENNTSSYVKLTPEQRKIMKDKFIYQGKWAGIMMLFIFLYYGRSIYLMDKNKNHTSFDKYLRILTLIVCVIGFIVMIINQFSK
jgi:predicted ATPase